MGYLIAYVNIIISFIRKTLISPSSFTNNNNNNNNP